MSIIYWIMGIFFLLVISFAISFLIGVIANKSNTKKITSKAYNNQTQFDREPLDNEKEVRQDEHRTNQKFREFERLRRLTGENSSHGTKDLRTPERGIDLPRVGELQERGLLPVAINKPIKPDTKEYVVPE